MASIRKGNFEINASPDSEGLHDGDCMEPGCFFSSRGWPTKTAASERMAQHMAEHETGEPMPELAESGIDRGV